MKHPAHTKLFAVIGYPIKHSLSPLIHNHAIAHYGLDSHYTKILLPSEISPAFLRDFIFSSDIAGLNITMPFKETALKALNPIDLGDFIDPLASKIGAINTLVKSGNVLKGYNTDAFGLGLCIESYKPKNVLILGAGGSAKSAAVTLLHKNIKFSVANRSAENLNFFKPLCESFTFDKLDSKILDSNILEPRSKDPYDVIINATSSSVNNALPLDSKVLESLFKNARLAFDLMYLKNDLTPFCSLARQCGIDFLDGKNMLVYQAAFSFCYFHNLKKEEVSTIITLMKKALKI